MQQIGPAINIVQLKGQFPKRGRTYPFHRSAEVCISIPRDCLKYPERSVDRFWAVER